MGSGTMVRRLVAGVATMTLLGIGLLALPTTAQGAPSDDRLFWVGSTTSPAVSDGLYGATASAVSVRTPNYLSQSGLYRTLATDGTYLYFSDGTNLVRTALDGTGKTTVVAGVVPEQVTFAGNYLYYTRYNDGVYGVSLASLPATASLLFTATGGGWDGVTVSGNTIYAIKYSAPGTGLYSATLNGVSPVTATMIDASAVATHAATKIYASAGKLYAAGSFGAIKVRDASGVWTAVSLGGVTSQSVYSVSVIGGTIYFSTGFGEIGSVGTNGSSPTILTSGSQFSSMWSVAAAPPAATPTYTVTYNANGATSGSVPVDYGSPYSSGSSVLVLSNTGNLANTDYQFARWDTTANNSGISRWPGTTFTIAGNTDLYALWVGGPFEFRTDPNGPAVTTAAFPAGAVGQVKDLTLYVRNVGAAATIGVPSSGVGAPLGTSTCPRVGGTIQQYNGTTVLDCTFNLQWTVAGNLTGALTFVYGMPTSSSVALTGVELSVARTPTFSSPVSTADGFTVNVTNWDSNWTWTPTVGAGTVTSGTSSGSTLPLTVSGLSASASATVTMTTSRANYVDGSAIVIGTASAASGGGSTPSTDNPTVTPTTPTTVTPAAPSPLGPQETAPVVGLRPGGTYVTTGGEQTQVSTTPNAPRGTVTSAGEGWTVAVGGRTPMGKPQPLGAGGSVQVPRGGGVHVTGTGYEPGTTVRVYAMDPALLLGTVSVGVNGAFDQTVTLPSAITSGRAILQLNGFAAGGTVRSYSLGVGVLKDGAAKTRTQKATVYFAAGSSWLDPTGKAVLDRLARSVPKGATSVSVVSTGYVQGTIDTSNDFTLSTQRAAKVAAQLKVDGVKGKYYATGRGVATESGALGRKVIVTLSYSTR